MSGANCSRGGDFPRHTIYYSLSDLLHKTSVFIIILDTYLDFGCTGV